MYIYILFRTISFRMGFSHRKRFSILSHDIKFLKTLMKKIIRTFCNRAKVLAAGGWDQPKCPSKSTILCWQLFYREKIGVLILHLLFICVSAAPFLPTLRQGKRRTALTSNILKLSRQFSSVVLDMNNLQKEKLSLLAQINVVTS